MMSLSFRFKCECPSTYVGARCSEFNPNSEESSGSSSGGLPIIPIAAGAGGGLLLLIILLVVLVRRRRSKKATRSYGEDTYDEVEMSGLQDDAWEIDRSRLKFGKILGSGNFGEVHLADLAPNTSGSGTRKVAVKMLKDGAPSEDTKDFLAEIKLMKEIGQHENVVGIIGHCLDRRPFMLVVELLELGNLRDYLKDSRASKASPQRINFGDMVSFSVQIANGMKFLAGKKIIHRDLAARNVLMSRERKCKVSDFGLARDVYTEDFYQKQNKGSRLPLKWMAPESIRDRVYTTHSDVWSFGVVMWEIAELGASPYPEFQNHEVLERIAKGYRMPKPGQCTDEYYDVMKSCWEAHPVDRPSFDDLVTQLRKMTQGSNEYEVPTEVSAAIWRLRDRCV